MKTNTIRFTGLLFLLALGLLLPFGCGGGGSDGATGGRGTLQVFMADAPDPTILAVEVDISRVEAHIGNSWEVVSSTPRTLDLFSTKFREALIA